MFTRHSARDRISAGCALAARFAFAIVGYDTANSIYHALRPLVLFWFCTFIINEIRSAGVIVMPVTIKSTFQSWVARSVGGSA